MFKEIAKSIDAEAESKPKRLLDVAKIMGARNAVMHYTSSLVAANDGQHLPMIVTSTVGLLETIAEMFANQGIDLDKVLERHSEIRSLSQDGVGLKALITEIINEQGYEAPKLPERPKGLSRGYQGVQLTTSGINPDIET